MRRTNASRTVWILLIVISSTALAVQSPQRERLSVNDPRPVASAILSLETRFSRVITYEDLPLVHPDDILDVTESVRRDRHKYRAGEAPKVLVPRGGEITIEYGPDDPLDVVLSHVLRETAFRTVDTNGIIHVVPQSIKGPTGETLRINSILDAPVKLSAQERTGMQMLEAWRDAVQSSSKKRIIIGTAPLNLLLSYKDDKGLDSPNARDALSEILTRSGKGRKLSWQLFYGPAHQTYAINIHTVR